MIWGGVRSYKQAQGTKFQKADNGITYEQAPAQQRQQSTVKRQCL